MQKKIIIGIIIVAILAVAFFWGGNAPDTGEINSPLPTERAEKVSVENEVEGIMEEIEPSLAPSMEPTETPTEKASEQESLVTEEPESNSHNVTSVLTEAPTSPEPENENQNTCTISVNCSTVLSNMDYLAAGKEAIIPSNGVILPPTTVTFFEGENIFQVLRRTLKREGVHLEFTNTPVYNTAYIEGIGNLYEFDCGELSGWVYRVNGIFPGYGCSRYVLSGGEKIEFLYTCNLGEDVGGNNIAK